MKGGRGVADGQQKYTLAAGSSSALLLRAYRLAVAAKRLTRERVRAAVDRHPAFLAHAGDGGDLQTAESGTARRSADEGQSQSLGGLLLVYRLFLTQMQQPVAALIDRLQAELVLRLDLEQQA